MGWLVSLVECGGILPEALWWVMCCAGQADGMWIVGMWARVFHADPEVVGPELNIWKQDASHACGELGGGKRNNRACDCAGVNGLLWLLATALSKSLGLGRPGVAHNARRTNAVVVGEANGHLGFRIREQQIALGQAL
ncbi:hypothetical protein QBC34DRAFT_499803 [Podospora aff. communis PSN243]|uniref:Uncharacterized protein n=1 Tax=Podospora aff. communis PSN243 TaxID=3040156 RepID=A0AAV9G4A9_9PEZI|nr:hypothetical protein QBC34DRAFT_499803 [Podospora aff. communis PSN243]